MPRPTISVITPAHPARARNGLLGQAMGSVYQQELLPDAIHVAIDVDGEGAAATRDRALRSARTDWVAFLDSDDMFMPKHLLWLMRHAQTTGADFVYSWFRVMLQRADGSQQLLEDDPVFPMEHYLNPFDPENPIETTITTLVRTELAQAVGFAAIPERVAAGANSGEDRSFTLGCVAAGGVVSHLVRRSWIWRHWAKIDGTPGNTGGLPTRGDAVG